MRKKKILFLVFLLGLNLGLYFRTESLSSLPFSLKSGFRRIREVENPPPNPGEYSYTTLRQAIERGEKLINPDGKEVVSTEWGKIDLKQLNNIPGYYRGRQALFYLARDLEIAITEGYIKMRLTTRGFSIRELNKLSQEFRDKIGAITQAIAWRTYFEIKKILEANPEKYRGDEGLVRLADKVEIRPDTLYRAFGDAYGWSALQLSVEEIKRAKEIFSTKPDAYKEDSGQIKLAREAKINYLVGLYSIRKLLSRYNETTHKWSALLVTLEEFDRVVEVFSNSPTKYKGQEGLLLLSKETQVDPAGIYSIRFLLPGYKQDQYNWQSP